MFSSLILISLLIILGTVHPGFVGGRYAVLPGVILIFIFFKLYLIEKNLFLKYFFLFILTLSITVGSIEYRFLSPTPNGLKCTERGDFQS